MDNEAKAKLQRDEEERAGKPLQNLYWEYKTQIGWEPKDYKLAVARHILSPDFRTRSKAVLEDRVQRISTKLTSGNNRDLPVDLTWRGFTEGLVITGVESLRICITTYRGRFQTKTISEVTTRVRDDLIRYDFEDCNEKPTASASTELNRFFRDCAGTAKTMEHPLSRLLWTIFANIKMTSDWWHRLSTNYVNNPENCLPIASKRNDMRHNMQHNMRLKKKLSWKWFMRILKAIDVKKFDILLTLKRKNDNKIYEVVHTVDLEAYQFRSTE